MSTSFSGPAAEQPDFDAPTALKALLEREGLAMSKRFGQNFLVSRTVRERIFAELQAGAGAAAWEIGPGIGAMTAIALDGGLDLTAFEIDHGFARLLRRQFGDRASFSLVEGDFLRTWRGQLAQCGLPDRVFGNLPYSAANAIVADLLEAEAVPRRMVFTLQKEAALRMAARPGSKDYSAFSVLCTSVCRVRLAFDVGASSFWPPPRVTSTVVVLEPRPNPVGGENRKGFSGFVRASFATRRKTLRNNLRAARIPMGEGERLLDAALDRLGVPADVRAEALAPEALATVYESLRAAS